MAPRPSLVSDREGERLQRRWGVRCPWTCTYQTAKDRALSSLGEARPRARSCSTRPRARRRSCTAACCRGPTSLQRVQTRSGPEAWERGRDGRLGGTLGEGPRVPWKGQVRRDRNRRVGGWAYGGGGHAPRGREELSPMLLGWNRKSHSPCCQEQGQETWFQPHVGH